MRLIGLAVILAVSLVLAPLAAEAQPAAPARVVLPTDRTVLPIPEPKLKPITELDARNAKAPVRFEVKVPAGAPNVVISTFGGAIAMPTLDRVASEGLRYNNFHTAAIRVPARTTSKETRA